MVDNIKENAEDKIIDWIALGTDGRLIAFKQEKEIDLVVQKKGDYSGKELFFILNTFLSPSKNQSFKMKISDTKLKNPKDLYLIFVIFDEIEQKIREKFWLISALEFIKISPSLQFDTDLFSKYLTDKNTFNMFLIQKLIAENKPKSKTGFKHKQY